MVDFNAEERRLTNQNAGLDKKVGEAQASLTDLADGMSKTDYREFLEEVASWCMTMATAADVQD